MVYVNLYIVHDPALTVRLENVDKVVSYVFGGRTIQKSICNRYTPEYITKSCCLEKGAVHPDSRAHLNLRGISNSLNHIDALTSIAAQKRCGPDTNLIIEDDSIVGSWSKEAIDAVIADAPKDYDVILLGGNRYPRTRVTSFVKFQPHRDDKFDVVAYIVRKRAAGAIVSSYFPIKSSHDVQMSELCQTLGLKIYQVDKSIFFDGSKTGAFIGTIHPEDYRLQHNDVFSTIEAVVNKQCVPAKSIERVKTYIEDNEHKHPHMRYLFANFLKMAGDPDSALAHYAYCMDKYEEAFQNVWKLQRFLLDYIHCCKVANIAHVSMANEDVPADSQIL